MIGRLNHVAIAVPDLEAAADQYRSALGANVGAPQDEPDHGVTVIFIDCQTQKLNFCTRLAKTARSKVSWTKTHRAEFTMYVMRLMTS